MNDFTNRFLFYFAALAIAAFMTTAVSAQAPQQITVEATVVTFDGVPLENVPLILHTSSSTQFVTKTDANGVATWSAPVPPGEQRVFIQVTGGGHDEFPPEEQFPLSLHLRALVEQYFFDFLTTIALDPNINNYTVQIIAQQTVQATGTFVDAAGAPVKGAISAELGSVYPTISNADGSFVIKGLKRNGAAWLFFRSTGAGEVFPMRLTPQQTAADVNVGQVVLAPAVANSFVVDPTAAQLSVRMINGQAAYEASIETKVSGITLISMDASSMYSFMGIRGNEEGVSVLRSGVVSVPAGSYYIFSDYIPTIQAVAILDAIEAGVDLSGSGIPTVTLTTGQQVDFTLDMLAAFQAINTTLSPY